MKKAYRYTVFTLLFAISFAIVSMEGIKYILREREKQLLTERGEVAIQSPIRIWKAWGEQEKKGSEDEGYSLTAAQVKEAAKSWNDRSGEILHDPAEGQISMENAIEAGEEWLAAMGTEEGDLQAMDKRMRFVRATLGVGVQKSEPGVTLEPYYSFWTVQFCSEAADAILYINAVTGKVWSAELTLYENVPEQIPAENLKLFARMAGLKQSGSTIETDEQGGWAVLLAEDGLLYAQMDYDIVTVGKHVVVEYADKEKFHEKYVVIACKILANPK